MTKKRNQNRKFELANKSAVESMRFLTHFGLRRMGCENGDMYHKLTDTEVDYIIELGLVEDLICLKNFTEGVKRNLVVEPTPKKGNFCASIVSIALGIARIPALEDMKMPVNWQDLIDKKILKLYYPEEERNSVVA